MPGKIMGTELQLNSQDSSIFHLCNHIGKETVMFDETLNPKENVVVSKPLGELLLIEEYEIHEIDKAHFASCLLAKFPL